MGGMPEQQLSTLGSKLSESDGKIYERLVVTTDTPGNARTLLGNVKPAELLAAPLKSPAYADAILAALWLWHDGLDECHHIVQKSPGDATQTYSFWHAIMHRREGDFSNSKYWYARAASHPVLQTLQAHASSAVNRAPADKTLLRLISNGWNPNAFVDFVESVHHDKANPLHAVAVELQRIEWQVLFDHCTRLA
jgi:hypothetical protein